MRNPSHFTHFVVRNTLSAWRHRSVCLLALLGMGAIGTAHLGDHVSDHFSLMPAAGEAWIVRAEGRIRQNRDGAPGARPIPAPTVESEHGGRRQSDDVSPHHQGLRRTWLWFDGR